MNFFTLMSLAKIIGQSVKILQNPLAVVKIANAIAMCIIFIQLFGDNATAEEKKAGAIKLFHSLYDVQELVGVNFSDEIDVFVKEKMISMLIELIVKLFNGLGIFATSKEAK